MLTEAQEKVLAAAKAQIQHKPWYRGICMDHFPQDREIAERGVDACADTVVCETAMWDAWEH